jgi:putative ubiquitin-RnfH superfamily antitoxin RatB of RatAB toxin-antitoxin module
MRVAVAYAEPTRQVWLRFDLPDGSTVENAIALSGILREFPLLDLERLKVGIHGRLVRLDTELKPGDRVEIYRAIIADPATVRRRPMADDDDGD